MLVSSDAGAAYEFNGPMSAANTAPSAAGEFVYVVARNAVNGFGHRLRDAGAGGGTSAHAAGAEDATRDSVAHLDVFTDGRVRGMRFAKYRRFLTVASKLRNEVTERRSNKRFVFSCLFYVR
jgi:hypothetical protein